MSAKEINMLADVSRAIGLAQALARPPTGAVRPGSREEIADEIVLLLSRTRDELLAGERQGT